MNRKITPRKHNPIAKALSNPSLRPRRERDRKHAAKRGYRKHSIYGPDESDAMVRYLENA